ncbi:hypothetical protein M407DRAFT_112106 [Tulasnella calospora MUT 4182]|uniref:Uncharacterized protein n=1 Tax=Tulasnella calospora MUT 4182 TaxID=1051891 RepID=A0A0C3QT28_9AGAM|nr:hypothetical protein M407DRAFT_112106 [Tulasnella calospora MUT 4182]
MIHDLLLPYLAPGEHELPLVKALIQRALTFLKTAPFDSAAVMGVAKGARELVIKLGSPIALRLELLSFFSAPEVLSCRVRFDPQVQMELLKFLGENLDVPMNDLNHASEELYLGYRNNVADDLNGWAKVLLTCRDQLWETAVPLLQTVLDKRRDDPQWQADIGALERLGDRLSSPNLPQAVLQQTKLAKLIIEDINAVRTAPQIVPKATQPPARPGAVPPGVQPLKSYGPPPKRKAEDSLVRPKDPPAQTPQAMVGIKGAATISPRNGDARPPIKRQASRDIPPASLLQRLALDRTLSSSSVSKADADSDNADGKAHDRPSKRRRQEEGAASAPTSKPGSLFSRIHQPSSSPGTPTSKPAQQSSTLPTPASASSVKSGGIASVQNGSNPLSPHARLAASAPPTPVPAAVPSTSGPPQRAPGEISLRGAAAAATQGGGQRNRTVSASATASSEVDLPPRPTGLSIKGASSVLAAGPPGKLGFQKALAGLGKTDSLPQRPRDVLPPAPSQAQPTPPARPPIKKQQSGASLLARFSDSPIPQRQLKSRGSLADRMDLG